MRVHEREIRQIKSDTQVKFMVKIPTVSNDLQLDLVTGKMTCRGVGSIERLGEIFPEILATGGRKKRFSGHIILHA
jgi:hypothetical protein